MINNPLFSWLPMQPAHGEIITCHCKKPLPDYIINKSKWLLPLDEYHCRIGATYEPGITEPTIHETSKQELITFAENLFESSLKPTCIDHQAGIRPATKDKQPFIGFHPDKKNTAIFNGFGSRGSLMIPWYARAFQQTLQYGKSIPAEADIQRYI